MEKVFFFSCPTCCKILFLELNTVGTKKDENENFCFGQNWIKKFQIFVKILKPFVKKIPFFWKNIEKTVYCITLRKWINKFSQQQINIFFCTELIHKIPWDLREKTYKTNSKFEFENLVFQIVNSNINKKYFT